MVFSVACCGERCALEWTGQQQLLFFWQSTGLGMLVGLVFDITSGLCRVIRRRWVVFLLDALFGVQAALITFFGALAIMDGQLHPLLFAGALVGFVMEHTSVGVYIGRGVCWCCRLFARASGVLLDAEMKMVGCFAQFSEKLRQQMRYKAKKGKKIRKKSNFFWKKS